MALFSFSELQATLNSKSQYSRKAYQFSQDALFEAQEQQFDDDFIFDVFLSHSYNYAHLNKDALLALQARLQRFNIVVYVDWIVDRQLSRSRVTARTARKLRMRMDHCKCLFFATSMTSQHSKWMPWELGYMDGRNGLVAILPIAAQRNALDFAGQEYLGIYPYVDAEYMSGTGTKCLWINNNRATYVQWRDWVNGHRPIRH